MKIGYHVLSQILALVVQYGNLASGLVPPKVQPAVALAVGVAQAVLAFIAHYSQPPSASK